MCFIECLCKYFMKCCGATCRLFCQPVSNGMGFFIQIIIYALFQGFNVGTDLGVFFEITKTYSKCNDVAEADLNGTDEIFCTDRGDGNFTVQGDLQGSLGALKILQGGFFFFLCLGGGIYVIHILVLIPNACKHWRDDNFENMLMEAAPYYQNILKITTMFMLVESVIHDMPVSSMAMELCSQMWGQDSINCWECVASQDAVPPDQSLPMCGKWLGLKLGSIALIGVYKGIMPLYLWLGNPFCWACYPLRICVVLPAGFLYSLLVLAPSMGVAKNRLFTVAPPMSQELGSLADTLWTFGMFFYGIVLIVNVLYCYFCGCPCKRKGGKGKDGGGGCLCF